MLNRSLKRNLKLAFKWLSLIVFIGVYFYLNHRFGKHARDTFATFTGGLGMFIFGMNLMSSSLQRIAGDRLKTIVSTLTKNPLMGMITGVFVTAVIQSSSATTVMTVGFVNAGIMTLNQAIGIILGANIGTTVTAQLIAFKLTDLAWPILAIGSAMIMFSKSRRNKSWGETLLGFALLFLGMKFMGDSLKAYRDHEVFKNTFIMLSQNRVLGVLAGLIVTLIVQSSSATVGLTMSLIGTGAFGSDPIIALKAAIPIILGDNIGTCITALLASVGASDNAKRTALAHTLFNVFGALIVLPFLGQFVSLMIKTSDSSMRQVANAHTIFNIGNGLLFLPLTGLLKKLVLLILPVKEEEDGLSTNLDKRILATPPIAIGQAERHLKQTTKTTKEMFVILDKAFSDKDLDLDDSHAYSSKIEKLGIQANQSTRELNKFLVSLAQKDLSEALTKQVTRLLYLAKDYEIVSNQLDKLANILRSHFEESRKLPNNAREELAICFNRTKEAFEQVAVSINIEEAEAENIKQTIYSHSMLDKAARNNHLDRIKSGEFDPFVSITFLDALRSISSLLMSIEYISEHSQFKF